MKTFKEVHVLLTILELAKNSLEAHRNFNLAEVHMEEYVGRISDKRAKKSIQNGLKKRDRELLLAVVEAEIERLSIEKIRLLRGEIVSVKPKKVAKKAKAKKKVVKKKVKKVKKKVKKTGKKVAKRVKKKATKKVKVRPVKKKAKKKVAKRKTAKKRSKR